MTESTNPLHSLIVQEQKTKTNARLKLYPGLVKMQVANRDIFKTGDWEAHDYSDEQAKKQAEDINHKNISESDQQIGFDVVDIKIELNNEQKNNSSRATEVAKARAKRAVEDIALLNHFDYMLTWTLDPQKVNRYDPDEVYRYLKPALSNLSQRKGFQYLIIPEYHPLKPNETRPGIHFHGLCNLGDVKIIRSMKRGRPRKDKQGRPVFNMIDWPYGWSTVVPLDENYAKAVSYIVKYITKQPNKILGKYYLSSRNLKKKPEILPLVEGVPFEEFRDEDKLISGTQFEANIYGDVFIITENIKE